MSAVANGREASPAPATTEWLHRRRPWQRFTIAALSGALMTAGHAPVDLPWAHFLAVPVVVLLVGAAPKPSSAVWIGWAAGFGYFVTSLHWVGYAFLVEPDRFAWLLPLGTAVLPAGLALFWAIAFWIARRLWPGGMVLGTLWIAALWTAAEYARSHVLTGLPWALPGYVWVETPVAQAAAWIGPFGLSFLALALTALPLVGLIALHGAARWALVCVPLAVGAVLWLAGTARLADTVPFPAETTVVRLVQPNAPQHLKWRPGHRELFYQRGVDITAAPVDPELGPPDVVIWPESALYFLPANAPVEMARLAGMAHGAQLFLGALHVEAAGDSDEIWYNSLFTIGADGQFGPRYDKHHLVPFGEYLPLPELFDAFGLRQFAIGGGFGRGPGPQTLTLPGLPPFSPLICYEAIFPHMVVGAERPDWMVQVTNDAWFGPFAGPQQHLAQARLRAIEQGLPLVRAANTGISAVIGPYGRITASMPLDTSGGIDAVLPAPLPATLYARTGDGPTLALLALILGAGIGRRVLSSGSAQP